MNSLGSLLRPELTSPDLFAMLKQETTFIHEKVMLESWAKRVLSLDYTEREYVELLQKYYGFYYPMESLLQSLKEPVFQRSRGKHFLLIEDLRFLNAEESFQLPICQKLPAVVDVPSALGICYVLEGAALGGQIIAKRLKSSLGLEDQAGLKFFIGHGTETMTVWNAFKEQTRDIVRTHEDSTKMLNAAIETFSSLSDWMQNV